MSALISAQRLKLLAPACDAEALAPALQSAAERYDIDTLERASHWLGQLHVESGGFARFVENLNYSAPRLTQVWPGRFPTIEAAEPFARNPAALAAKVYDGRLGNLSDADAARFIGRGLIQITGRANYELYGQVLGLDLLGNPGIAAQPAAAALIAGAFWNQRNLNPLADRDDVAGITRKINGGLTGLIDRRMQVERAKRILAA